MRQRGFSGRLLVVGAEDELPYERPPLSKDYLAGESDFSEALVHDADWYDSNATLLRGVRAVSLDVHRRLSR